MVGDASGGAGAPADADPESDALLGFVELEVEAALAPFVGRLAHEDLELMRAELMRLALEDESVSRVVRAALPRDGDQSAELRYRGRGG